MADPVSSQQGVYAQLSDLIALRHKARGFSFLPRQPVHSILAGRHASRLRGRGLEFEELRGYLPGDDIRSIDWRVTARTRKPHTRVYSEERDRPSLLLVDQRVDMFFGSVESMKSVTAAEAAALAAWRLLDSGDRVGALVFNDRGLDEIRPHRSQRRVMQILGTIIEQNHALSAKSRPAPGMLNEVLRVAERVAKHDYLLTLVTDLAGYDEETERRLTRLAQHNDVLVALIYDPLEAELPEIGEVVVSDGDQQLQIDSQQGDVRQKFARLFSDSLAQRKAALQRYGIPVLPISTAGGVAEQVREQLGHHSSRSPRG